MAMVELVNVGYGMWVYCENMVIVELLNAGSCNEPELMQLSY